MLNNPYPAPLSNRHLTTLAWVVTGLISTVPDIAFDQLADKIPAWLAFAKMGLLLALSLAAFIYRPLRPLRNFFIVMFAFFGLFALLPLVNFSIPALQALFGKNVFYVRMQAEQIGKLTISLAMIVVLLVLRYKRVDFFLRGDDNSSTDAGDTRADWRQQAGVMDGSLFLRHRTLLWYTPEESWAGCSRSSWAGFWARRCLRRAACSGHGGSIS